jgi:L-threonylcarbamoyladenylate synthase
MALVRVDPEHPDPAVIARAAAILRDGGLVAFPTETVYGLGANALDAAAVQRIYDAKGRPAYNPLIVHIANASDAKRVCSEWNERADKLARAFWPGPITLVLPRRADVPDAVSAGLPTVAVRVPSHPVARALLAAAGLPIAAPSANKSTQVSPTSGSHVERSLGDAVKLILDAGPTSVGIESTVLDVCGDATTLLRPGTITLSEIEAIVGPVTIAHGAHEGEARPSPGMMDKHYSPRATLVLVEESAVGVRAEHERASMRRVGALVVHSDIEPAATVIRMPSDARAYAARLYDALHRLDEMSCDIIIAERVPDAPEWLGVRDRLTRAAR